MYSEKRCGPSRSHGRSQQSSSGGEAKKEAAKVLDDEDEDASSLPRGLNDQDSGAEEEIDGRPGHRIKGEKRKIEANFLHAFIDCHHYLCLCNPFEFNT